MVDWSRLPDLGAVGLLTCAFASVAKRGQTPQSAVWLLGWLMIVLHFLAYMFLNVDGAIGPAAAFIGISALTWAGVLFTWAAVPYRKTLSSEWMVGIMLSTNTLYIGAIILEPNSVWLLTSAAILLGALPLATALFAVRSVNSPQRWAVVFLYGALSVFLLMFQHRPGNGQSLAINAVLCTAYLGCCVYFSHTYGRATAGALITNIGFFAWASVFVVGPLVNVYLPSLHFQDEVWNLPKYLVAIGMILLLLEEQIEHNKYLALHDELTGLPNRRLFLDRLASALERARRMGTQTVLLLVDLDHFKTVNDTFGHHTGDRALERVGAILSGRVRRSDTVARTGGDEFSIVLEEPTTREDAQSVATALGQLLAEPLQAGEHMVSVGASIGLAVFPDDAATLEALCIAADLRMYNEKYESRDAAERGNRPDPPAQSPRPQRPTLAASE